MRTFTFTGPEAELRVRDATLLKDTPFETDDNRLIGILTELPMVTEQKPESRPKKDADKS